MLYGMELPILYALSSYNEDSAYIIRYIHVGGHATAGNFVVDASNRYGELGTIFFSNLGCLQ